jgi:predicted PurR-regulated permease PerM
MPKALSNAAVLIGGLAGLGGVLTFVIMTFINGLPALQAQLAVSVDATTHWLATGPLHLSPLQLGGIRDSLLTALNANPASLTTGALSTAAAIATLLPQILLVLFTLIFFLHGGADIWRFLIRAAPARCEYASMWPGAAVWPRWSATSEQPWQWPSSTR